MPTSIKIVSVSVFVVIVAIIAYVQLHTVPPTPYVVCGTPVQVCVFK